MFECLQMFVEKNTIIGLQIFTKKSKFVYPQKFIEKKYTFVDLQILIEKKITFKSLQIFAVKIPDKVIGFQILLKTFQIFVENFTTHKLKFNV